MAQVKVTEYFNNTCKRRYDIQPHKRRKIVEDSVHVDFDSVRTGKCFGNEPFETEEIGLKSTKVPKLKTLTNNHKTRLLAQPLPRKNKKNVNTKSSRKVGLNANPNSSQCVDIRQAFASVKLKGHKTDVTLGLNCVPEVKTLQEETLELLTEVQTICSTPKKKHSLSVLSAECSSPPKRRRQHCSETCTDRGDRHVQGEEHSGTQMKISVRRSLLMEPEKQQQEKSEAVPGNSMKTGTLQPISSLNNTNLIQHAPEEKRNFTHCEIMEKLAKCGKLESVKELLLSIKRRTEKLKRNHLAQTIDVSIKPSPSKSPISLHTGKPPENVSQPTPAYERYHSLAAEGTPSLSLPYKYKLLAEIFRSVETVVSILHNRQEICTFSKLKFSVQEMMTRAFEKYSLGQIKTVFPLAYFFQQEKNLPSFASSKHRAESFQLTITPNFNYSIPVGDNINLPKSAEVLTERKKMQQMNPSCLLERRTIFHRNLLTIVKKHHQAFLEGLNPPLVISNEKLQRWHPHFSLDDVPEIEASPLPEAPGTTYSTAQDVLNRVQSTLGEKVENALKSVAEKKNALSQEDASCSAPATKLVTSGALKGISKSLLEKIRAKEAKRIAKEMTRRPEDEKKLEMMARLPEFIRILRAYFITEKKAAIPVEKAKMKLFESYHSPLSLEDVEQHINLLSELLPDWLFQITISRGVFLKIDKSKEVSSLLELLETEKKRIM